MVRVAEYVVIRDGTLSIRIPGQEEHFEFSVPPEIVRPSADNALNHRRPLLTYMVDPSANADVTLTVEINDQRIVRWTYKGGVGRMHQEVLSHEQLRVGENSIQFRIDAMEGSHFQHAQISDVVIWFQKEVPV